MDESTRYGGFTVLTECNHCGNPLPLHGPRVSAPCPNCLQEAQIPAAVWRTILEEFDEQYESLAEGQGDVSATMAEALNVRHEYKKHVPSCEKCGAPFGVDQLPVGADMNFSCTECGDPASTHPVPDWLRRLVPTARQYYSTEPRTERSGALELGSTDAVRPVAMACPACGGSLAATSESERVMVCRYCQTDVYLPDEVWRRLHPVATVQEWFIRFEGKTRTQLAADEQAAREAKKSHRRAERKRRKEEMRLRRAEQERIARQDAEVAREQRQLQEKRDIARMKAWAYIASLLFVFGLVAISELAWLEHRGSLALGLSDTWVVVPLLAMMFLLLVVTLVLVGRPIQKATGYDGDWMLFCIWFWLPFALVMPAVGQLMALARALILFRGKFGASTITTNNSSSSSYAATRLTGGEGRPAAIVFLALALLYPLAMATLFVPANLQELLNQAGIVQTGPRPELLRTNVQGIQAPSPK